MSLASGLNPLEHNLPTLPLESQPAPRGPEAFLPPTPSASGMPEGLRPILRPAHASQSPDFVRFTLSLGPLLGYWDGLLGQPQHPLYSLALRIAEGVTRFPELRGPLLEQHKIDHGELISDIMVAVFPQGLQRFSFSAAATPGTFEIHFATPRFRRELLDEACELRGEMTSAAFDWDSLGKLHVCLAVARSFYHLDFPFQSSLIYRVADRETGLTSYYQMRVHLEHVRFQANQPVQPLHPSQIQELRRNLGDLAVWRRVIPLHNFEMLGMLVLDATEITEEIVMASIQQELVAKDCLRDRQRLLCLQTHFRELLRVPDLVVAVPTFHDQQVLVFSPFQDPREASPLLEDACAFTPEEGCEEYRSCGRSQVIEDLASETDLGPCAQDILDMGMRSYMSLPLHLEETIVGSLVCTSPRPDIFNQLTPSRLGMVLPQLARAVQRTIDSVEHKIQSVMKERFTAIHPAVEWRFRQDAVAVVKGQDSTEDIIFNGLYPLFGTSDVRDSTVIRNRAIVADLISQLSLAEQVLLAAQAARPLGYIDSLRFRISSWKDQLSGGLNTGDESRALEFLKHELEPLFTSLTSLGFSVDEAVGRYRNALEPRLGLVYEERKLYEQSMSLVRETAAEILVHGQEQAQRDYPHYFEIHKTDGVDHTMYIGASMVDKGNFDLLFLRNLRLWQLQTMVEVVRRTRELTRQMELKMQTAHLILVQDSPISIRFSLEEKQFNVDGSYNARYEILKKRIDKAEVRETGERLTQPGKLAIVYSHPREAAEYNRYLRYLSSQGAIEEALEDVELAALQGVSGLRALRVQVAE